MRNNGGWNYDPRESGYQEQVQIVHVLQQLGHRLVVIDADDLMENPVILPRSVASFTTYGILRAYCQEGGLEFKPSMIHWEPLSEPDFQETFLCGVWEAPWMTSLSGQKRIMLWSVPRSLSTAMCRVMLNSGLTTKVMFEPYGNSYHFGPERVSTRYPRYPIDPSKSYSNIKKRQELPYDDKELVFVKNMAYHLAPDRLTAEWIPDGFTHTFIIRNPRSTIISKLKVHNNFTGWNYDPRESGYQEQVQIAHVLQQLGHRLVVIDADDLMENPEGILRAYCREVGLEFKPSMIHWEPLSEPDFQETFICGVWQPSWFTTVRTSTGLYPKPKRAVNDTGNDVSYDAETRDLIDRCEQENTNYYEELCALRLTA